MAGWFRSFGTLTEIQTEIGRDYFITVNIDIDALFMDHWVESSGEEADLQSERTNEMEVAKQKLIEWANQVSSVSQDPRQRNYVGELSENGLLLQFHKQLLAGKSIELRSLLRELLIQDTMASVLNDLEQKGMRAKIQNYDGAYFIMKVTECQMSFGGIYSLIESIKDRYQIKDYSCKMSSLEEVFNAHATESMYMELNRRLERRRSSFVSVQD